MNAELFALNKSSSKRRKHDYPGKSLSGIYPVCLKILNSALITGDAYPFSEKGICVSVNVFYGIANLLRFAAMPGQK